MKGKYRWQWQFSTYCKIHEFEMHLIVSSNFNKWYPARQNNGFLGREKWPLLRQVGRYAVWMWIAAGSKPNCWKPFKRPRSSYDDDGVGSGWKYHSRSRFILSESIFTSGGEWVEWVRSERLLNCWVYFFSLPEVLSMCEEVPWLNKWLAGMKAFPKHSSWLICNFSTKTYQCNPLLCCWVSKFSV